MNRFASQWFLCQFLPLCIASSFSFAVAQESTQEEIPAATPAETSDAVSNSASEASSTEAASAGVDTSGERQDLILVAGAPGTDEYRTTFAGWAARWEDAAGRGGVSCTVIGKTSTDHRENEATLTDLDRLKQAITSAGEAPPTEPLWIVFIGHGTFDGRTASWNLQGPDISAEQLAEVCQGVQRPLAVVICASCSAPFVNALSGPNRVIVSATKDGNQIQYSRFGDVMSLAVSTLEADINRDGQTSLLEAWLFASRRTADFYKGEGRLATEHALLEDNGDAKGVRAEIYEGDRIASNAADPDQIDGSLAARWHLLRTDEERRLSPEQRQTRDQLEQQIEQLRKKKENLQEADYLQELEALLIPLAELYNAADGSPK